MLLPLLSLLSVAEAAEWFRTFDPAALGIGNGPLTVVSVGSGADEAARALVATADADSRFTDVILVTEKKADEDDLVADYPTTLAIVRAVKGTPGVVVVSWHASGQVTWRAVGSEGVPLLTPSRLTDLDKRVTELEKKRPSSTASKPSASSEEEQAASTLLKEAQELTNNDDYDAARAKLAVLDSKYPSTRAARAAKRLESELSIIGKKAVPLEVEQWYQGQAADYATTPTLLVFWEAWCPHCKREVPKLQEMADRYAGRMQLVGLTKQTRNITDENVRDFINERGVRYAIAKENGDQSNHYGVRGIPAAAMLVGGEVVWRGHPARLDDPRIERLLAR